MSYFGLQLYKFLVFENESQLSFTFYSEYAWMIKVLLKINCF